LRGHPRGPVLIVAAVCALFAAAAAQADAACPNEGLREQQHSTLLPQCRGYEMVSPPNKNGSDLNFDFDTVVTSPSGDSVSFQSGGAFAGVRGTTGSARYLAVRGAGDWETVGLNPPYAPNNGLSILSGGGLVVGFSPDLTRSIFQLDSPALDPGVQSGVMNLYTQVGSGLDYRRVTTLAIPNTGPFTGYVPYFADATADFGHVIFESNQALTPEASEVTQLYESLEGQVRLVGRLPDGTVPTDPVVAGTGASVVPLSQTNGAGANTENTISADGSKIVFTVVPPFQSPNEGQIYVRLNGTSTVHVSASERTDCAEVSPCTGSPVPDPAGPLPALYRWATPDGSAVFFTSSEQLVDQDTDNGPDLYRFDVGSNHLTLLSPDLEPADGAAAGVLGTLGFSDSGNVAYFVAEGQIVPGAPLAPGPKLYVFDGTVVRYIGPLSPEDSGDWAAIASGVRKDSRVTPSGDSAFFLSRSSLGGADNVGHAAAYVYDLSGNSVSCASCRPDGGPSTGDALINDSSGGATAAAYRHPMLRTISDDGSLVTFMTSEALLPQDSDGVMDVYGYDTRTKELWLISSGRSDTDSYIGTMTPNGRDVFFLTRQRLVGSDIDNNLDLYDARIDGGIPVQVGSPASQDCSGEGCKESSAAPVQTPTPASSAVQLPAEGKKKQSKPRKHKKQEHGKHKHRKHKGRGDKSKHHHAKKEGQR
jgi:hypothetical protein